MHHQQFQRLGIDFRDVQRIADIPSVLLHIVEVRVMPGFMDDRLCALDLSFVLRKNERSMIVRKERSKARLHFLFAYVRGNQLIPQHIPEAVLNLI